MSDARQQVVLSDSLTGRGKRPVRTPFHHVERLTGINFRIWGSRRSAAGSIWDCCADAIRAHASLDAEPRSSAGHDVLPFRLTITSSRKDEPHRHHPI